MIGTYLDEIDMAILYDVIESYAKRYGLNATEAVKFYESCRRQEVLEGVVL